MKCLKPFLKLQPGKKGLGQGGARKNIVSCRRASEVQENLVKGKSLSAAALHSRDKGMVPLTL